MTEADDLPPIGAPATRALHAAGFTCLEQVAGVPECELAQLHGVGPKALRLLREALADRGLSFRLMPGPDSGGVDPVDVALRNETYRLFVALGRAPTATETGAAFSATAQEVRAGWQRLHAAHALVLDSAGAQIRMANPFSAVPTAYRVSAAGRWWYANCALDAFGICAALHTDGRIATSCADCGKSVRVAVDGGRPHDGSLLFHCLVPARQWWDDITFTQSTMNLFRSEEHVDLWLGDRAPGATLDVATLNALAHAWWGDRLAPDWTPHSVEQNQAILDGVGLTGAFWQLS